MEKNKKLNWIPFTRAAQAQKGREMRPLQISLLPGIPKSYTVLKRERKPGFGNYIYFKDGSHIKISDAKSHWLVLEKN